MGHLERERGREGGFRGRTEMAGVLDVWIVVSQWVLMN